MRIVLDLQGVQTESRFRGIGRYSLSLALAMARKAGRHEIWLALNGVLPDSVLDIRHAFAGLIPPERIRVFDIPYPAAGHDPRNGWRTRAAELIREHFLQGLDPDIVHISSIFEGFGDDAVSSFGSFVSGDKAAVTVYDFIPLLDQQSYLPTKPVQDYYFRKLNMLKEARLLLAISDHTRKEAIRILGLPSNKVVNLSAAVDSRFRSVDLTEERSRLIKRRYGVSRKMLMYAPGGFDVRKNFGALIKAFALLPSELRTEYQLVIVSKTDDRNRASLEEQRRSAGLSDDALVVTGYVPDDDLVALYNLADLFVFPSLSEGFGLPVLEAMTCGAPTIGSNTTSIPEVIGWEDALFDPSSPASIAQKIIQGLRDDQFRRRLRERGIEQSRNFSWDISAERALMAFESAISPPTSRGQRPSTATASNRMPPLLDSLSSIRGKLGPRDSDLADAARAIAFNMADHTSRQLLLDISELVQRDAKSGIQRVVRSILRHLLKNPPTGFTVRPIYFDGQRYRYATSFISRFQGDPSGRECVDEVAEFNQDDIYLALDLNAQHTPAVHSIHMRLKSHGIRIYFIVYDLLPARRPDWWREGTSKVFLDWMKSISQVATGLVCISEAVATEMREWIRSNPPPRLVGPDVRAFHLGADLKNSVPSTGIPPEAAEVLSALRSKPSFLTVGTLEPRKGQSQALDAFELLWAGDADLNLVIVGRQGWLVETLAARIRSHPERNSRLFWLEAISDEYLEAVYSASSCLLVPSEGEGFGLPLIEAAQHHLPIIARDLPVFREVAGEHAYYFEGLGAEQLANAIDEWLKLKSAGAAPTVSGMTWLTWEQSARQLLEAVIGSP